MAHADTHNKSKHPFQKTTFGTQANNKTDKTSALPWQRSKAPRAEQLSGFVMGSK